VSQCLKLLEEVVEDLTKWEMLCQENLKNTVFRDIEEKSQKLFCIPITILQLQLPKMQQLDCGILNRGTMKEH